MTRAHHILLALGLTLGAAAAPGLAQIVVPWSTVDGGGGKSTSADGQYVLSGTIAQHDAQALASSANGRYALKSGYWVPYTPAPVPSPCGTSDFDGDGDAGTDFDIQAFFSCLGGDCCATCWHLGADFNGDGDSGTDADIEAFFRVLGGGAC